MGFRVRQQWQQVVVGMSTPHKSILIISANFRYSTILRWEKIALSFTLSFVFLLATWLVSVD
jgi:hypothetical protein